MNKCFVGDCREMMRDPIAEGVRVQMCVSSPPYWGLRDYGTAQWEGGDDVCEHRRFNGYASGLEGGKEAQDIGKLFKDVCGLCGARRIDRQLGLESTPAEYVANMVEVFSLVRDLLAEDGTLWLNLGDSYSSGSGGYDDKYKGGFVGREDIKAKVLRTNPPDTGLPPKNLVGIPWRVAFALQASGWVLRQEIIWEKPNPMPESVRDRCTKAHEQIFLFAKAKWVGNGEPPIWIPDVDKAWLAALIDGEGTICFQDKQEQEHHAPNWTVRLSIVNTNRELLERAAAICNVGGGPGSPSPRIRGDKSPGRPIFSWQVTNSKAAKVIAAIRPYLIAKRTQADLALSVHVLNQKHKGRGGYVTSTADVEFKRKAAECCSALNHGIECDLSWFVPIVWGRWDSQPYYFDAQAIAEPASYFGNDARSGQGNIRYQGKRTLDTSGANGQQSFVTINETRNRRSVWTVPTAPYAEAHFATFPPALIEPCIMAGSRVGDVVLDPFMGSGTTGQVAQDLGRRWIGCELNEAYAKLQERRTAQQAMVF